MPSGGNLPRLRSWRSLTSGVLTDGPAHPCLAHLESGLSDSHCIIGNCVKAFSIRIADWPGGFGVRFPLGLNPVVQSAPSFLYDTAAYGACVTERFLGNDEDMEPAIRIAFRNCIQ